ncbi:MAG: type II toxin-antitoxin system HicA family toxin [Chloroflexota bacterium]
MRLRELERHLMAHGARKVGEGARHTKWRSSDGARATAVPRHNEIGPGFGPSDLQAARHFRTGWQVTFPALGANTGQKRASDGASNA